MTLKVLQGHTSEETAYLVDDYPYGFRLRCKIRYWLEYRPKKGFRFCSQTTNPKRGDVWNTPKKSTYCELAVMGLNAEDHVTWTGCSIYDSSKLAAFGEVYAEFFDEHQKTVSGSWRQAILAYEKRSGVES